MERSTNVRWAALTATLPAGLLAGALFFGRVNVLPTFDQVPLDVHLTFRVALFAQNGVVMPALMALAFAGAVWLAVSASGRQRVGAVAAAGLTAVTFLVTRFGNVPVNDEVRAWLAAGPPPDFAERLQVWGVYNDIRLVTAVAAFAALVVSMTVARRPAPVGTAR
jgi:uncharacterized membrane protein